MMMNSSFLPDAIVAAGGLHDGSRALWTLCLAVGGGCLLTIASRKLHLPTIVLLLFGGVALGPEGLGWLAPNELGELLPIVVSLAVGLILFEGGLTLELKGFSSASTVIRRLLSVGVLVTWVGAALAVYLTFDTSASFALLTGSLVIVTGPTVIVPLLRRIRVQQRLGDILHWEGVLIDSVGVFIAILCFEWVVGGGGGMVALPMFLLRVVSGIAIGTAGGLLIALALKRHVVPDSITNAFAVASALLLFGLTELIATEAGLLSVTIAGLIVGIKRPRQLREVRAFKAEITDLLIGMLFLLLVSRLELDQFIEFFRNGGIWALLAIILVVRPINILVSSWGTGMNWREITFLSWVAPRGVVAASMASLFALSLGTQENPIGNPALLESFTYSVICATVLLQGLSAGVVARLLGLRRPSPDDWVIIGAHAFGRELARSMIKDKEQSVILLDTNARNVAIACEEGLLGLNADGMEAEKLYEEEQALFGAGRMLALTDNVELNQLLMQRWAGVLEAEQVYGWIPADSPNPPDQLTGQAVFANLSRPGVIGSELVNGQSGLEVIEWEESSTLPSGDWHPLFLRRGKTVKPVPDDGSLKELARPEDQILCLRRAEGYLARALNSGGFHRVEADDIEHLYQQLARIAADGVPDLSEETVLERIHERERSFPTVIGRGVSLPNIYCEELDMRACFVCRIPGGLQLSGHESAIRLVFFLLSPLGDSTGHLTTLSEIAQICRNEGLRTRLLEAKTLDDVMRLTHR